MFCQIMPHKWLQFHLATAGAAETSEAFAWLAKGASNFQLKGCP